MSLAGVKMSEEVWLSCLTHALSTETEEIMGLLLGDIQEDYALVWGAVPQARLDRRKDRVETTPEQLAAATHQAEEMSKQIGNNTRVIGWYHSHPHITVLPSHVDLRTQATFQMLEQGFVGIIFSCFDDAAGMVGRIQATAFQSGNGGSGLTQFASAQQSGASSEYLAITTLEDPTVEDPPSSPLKLLEGPDEAVQQLSPSLQEAMHLSSLDMSSARKPIDLQVVPCSKFKLANIPPDPLLSLQRLLFEEERDAYAKAMAQCKQGEHVHPLGALHHSVTYQASLCRLLELCLSPTMVSLWDRVQQNKAKLALLQEEAASLQLFALNSHERVRLQDDARIK